MTGKELRELRRTKGWTQLRLADEAGIEQNEISHYELGTRPISRLGARLFTYLLSPQWHLIHASHLAPPGIAAAGEKSTGQ